MSFGQGSGVAIEKKPTMQRLAESEYARLASALDSRGLYEEADALMGLRAMQAAIDLGGRPSDANSAATMRQDMAMFRVAVKHGYFPETPEEQAYKSALLSRLDTTILAYDGYYEQHGHNLIRLANTALRTAQEDQPAPEQPKKLPRQLYDDLLRIFDDNSDGKAQLVELGQEWSPERQDSTVAFVRQVFEEELNGKDTNELKPDSLLSGLFGRHKVNESSALMKKFLAELPSSPDATRARPEAPPPTEPVDVEPVDAELELGPDASPETAPTGEVAPGEPASDDVAPSSEELDSEPTSVFEVDPLRGVRKLFAKFTPKIDWLQKIEQSPDVASAGAVMQQALAALRAGQEGYKKKTISKRTITLRHNAVRRALEDVIASKFGEAPVVNEKQSPEDIADRAVQDADVKAEDPPSPIVEDPQHETASGMSAEQAIQLVSEASGDPYWFERMKQMPDDPKTALSEYLAGLAETQKSKMKGAEGDDKRDIAEFLTKLDSVHDVLMSELPETWDADDFGHQGYGEFPSPGYKTYGHKRRVMPDVAFALVSRSQPSLLEKLLATDDPGERQRLVAVAARHEYKHLSEKFDLNKIPVGYQSTYSSLLKPDGWQEVVDAAKQYVADPNFQSKEHKDFAHFKSEIRREERDHGRRVMQPPSIEDAPQEKSSLWSNVGNYWADKIKGNKKLARWLLGLLAAGGIGGAGYMGHQSQPGMKTEDVLRGQQQLEQRLKSDPSPPAATGRELLPGARPPSSQITPQRSEQAPPPATTNPYSVKPDEYQRMLRQLQDIEKRHPSK